MDGSDPGDLNGMVSSYISYWCKVLKVSNFNALSLFLNIST